MTACSKDENLIIFIHRTTVAKEEKLECGPMPNVMAALPNIRGALCESSVIPFPVPRRAKFGLRRLLACRACSNVANIAERKTWT